MTYDELRIALRDMRAARETIRSQANTVADLFIESIDDVSPFRLKQIKKRLRAFDAHRGCWTC